jgi:hypothetical protein
MYYTAPGWEIRSMPRYPLHAALTDIPIGARTAAVVFDVIDITTDRRQWGAAADASPESENHWSTLRGSRLIDQTGKIPILRRVA